MSRELLIQPLYVPKVEGEPYELFYQMEISEAIRAYEALAKHGSNSASAVCGYLYLTGTSGRARDLVAARRYCETPAADGYSYAQFVMGWIEYEEGHLSEAVTWMRLGANKGFGPAVTDLGRLTGAGIGVPCNLVDARALFLRGHRLGHRCALVFLGQLYRSGKLGELRRISGLAVVPFARLRLVRQAMRDFCGWESLLYDYVGIRARKATKASTQLEC